MFLGLCSSHLELDECSLQYGTNVNTPINLPFQLPLLDQSMTYYFQASIDIGDNLKVILQGIHTTGECDVKQIQVRSTVENQQSNIQHYFQIHWYQNISFFIISCVFLAIIVFLLAIVMALIVYCKSMAML